MRRNFTLSILALCLLVVSSNSFGQTSCSVSTTNPSPTPGFGSSLAVNSGNGFTGSGQTTVGTYPNGTSSTLNSPAYSYTTAQNTVYFKYHLAAANNPSALITGYTITVIYQGGSFTCSSGAISLSLNTTGADYYFTITNASPIPANKYFRIVLTLDVAGSGNKDVVATSFQTNAILAPAGTVLPVKFSSFEATPSGNSNYLTWKVGTEENLSGYEVQRSADGSDFSKIGFVPANGQPLYSFVDSKTTGLVYYRIKSIDLDGKYAYSIVVSLKGQQSNVMMKAFPMPVQNQVTIQHNSATNNSKIEIVSADGRMIKSVSVSSGSQQSSVDLSSIKTGVYVVRYINNDNVESLKIIKQ